MIIKDELLLREKCEDVAKEDVASLILLLEEELKSVNKYEKRGIGLAAPQIGINKKAAIIRFDGIEKINLINCTIEKGFDQAIFKDEACLSFPGITKNTLRYQEIYIINNLVYPYSFIASGILSVVCQHEIDHFNGILFHDRVKLNLNPNDLCICGKVDFVTGKPKKFKKCCGR